jgi:hypothetical protein
VTVLTSYLSVRLTRTKRFFVDLCQCGSDYTINQRC